MDQAVKNPQRPRPRQTARTERLIIAAASELFVERGYVATTLTDVAEHADVAARTVYSRFGTKAELLKRVVDVAIVGDTEPLDVLSRPTAQLAMTAPTQSERIDAQAAMTRHIMARTGRLFAVAKQAAAIEPLIETFWEQGRAGTRHVHEQFWTNMREDQLLDRQIDLDWVVATSTILGSAETYLLTTQLNDWTLDDYQQWLVHTLTHLATPLNS